ncbi:hypothetical protein [Spiroplasma endosymbiont of Dasysyrphus albostriatus]
MKKRDNEIWEAICNKQELINCIFKEILSINKELTEIRKEIIEIKENN